MEAFLRDMGFENPSPVLLVNHFERSWYALYTRANHEKRVGEQLGQRSIDYFLPLYDSVRKWKDRRVRLQLPLFPGYVFVRIHVSDRLRVLEIPSVARLVGFNGNPTALRDDEVESLRRVVAEGTRAEPHPYLAIGRRVRIVAGPLSGREGILVRRKCTLNVVVSIALLQRS